MSKFDEWFESQKRTLYAEDDKWIAKKGWEARQQEIDELQAMYEKQGLYAFELQKRIDETLMYLRHVDSREYQENIIAKILKGNQNEN